MSDLLPCPFCGGDVELDTCQYFRHYRTGEPLAQVSVECTRCSASISHYPGDLDCDRAGTVELCTAAWNTRVASHPATSTPVADQKPAETSDNLAATSANTEPRSENARLVAEIVAWLRDEANGWMCADTASSEIEAKFGGRDGHVG